VVHTSDELIDDAPAMQSFVNGEPTRFVNIEVKVEPVRVVGPRDARELEREACRRTALGPAKVWLSTLNCAPMSLSVTAPMRPSVTTWTYTETVVYLGWAYLPEIVNKPGHSHLDGVVIDWGSLLRTSKTYAGQFDEGKTATHEVGHWLDLEHTFYRGCSAGGDYVADTPRRRPRRRDAPPARTPARPPASTRSTTTWTTRSTAATRSSRPARCSGCATPGCTTGRPLSDSPPPGQSGPALFGRR
jgi:hypothetical protein